MRHVFKFLSDILWNINKKISEDIPSVQPRLSSARELKLGLLKEFPGCRIAVHREYPQLDYIVEIEKNPKITVTCATGNPFVTPATEAPVVVQEEMQMHLSFRFVEEFVADAENPVTEVADMLRIWYKEETGETL